MTEIIIGIVIGTIAGYTAVHEMRQTETARIITQRGWRTIFVAGFLTGSLIWTFFSHIQWDCDLRNPNAITQCQVHWQ